MTLSEAIRLGAMSGPQARGMMYAKHRNATCALGAAALAAGLFKEGQHGVATDGSLLPRTQMRFPVLTRPVVDGIIGLNDRDHLTREQIADYVEWVEQDMQQIPPSDAVCAPDLQHAAPVVVHA